MIEALTALHTEPFECQHCNRTIPADMVASFDCSGCPLVPPCVRKPRGPAWPGADDDDDSGEPVNRPLAPVEVG